jgi:hypothetical protein
MVAHARHSLSAQGLQDIHAGLKEAILVSERIWITIGRQHYQGCVRFRNRLEGHPKIAPRLSGTQRSRFIRQQSIILRNRP